MSDRAKHYRTAAAGGLTPRQEEVLGLIASGRTNPEIAAELGVTIDGAKFHVREILGKLGVDSREEAAEWWRAQQGIRPRVASFFSAFASIGWLKVSLATIVAGGGVLATMTILALVSGGDEPPAAEELVLAAPTASVIPVAPAPTPILACTTNGCAAAAEVAAMLRSGRLAEFLATARVQGFTCDESAPRRTWPLCDGAAIGDEREGVYITSPGENRIVVSLDMFATDATEALSGVGRISRIGDSGKGPVDLVFVGDQDGVRHIVSIAVDAEATPVVPLGMSYWIEEPTDGAPDQASFGTADYAMLPDDPAFDVSP